MFEIKKPPHAREAKKVTSTDLSGAAPFNLGRVPHFCKPSIVCDGAYELGREAAIYFLRYGGIETNFLEELLTGVVCSSCRANRQAGYFITKYEILEASSG